MPTYKERGKNERKKGRKGGRERERVAAKTRTVNNPRRTNPQGELLVNARCLFVN
ncbi:hypothetical protein G9A89_014557 [Geosiphon pyriformis]|nr:hypothetical protein G9A89_014557 [Geosiphon pyriformis]